MREILFRGKRIDNGAWVDGCYMTDEQDLSKSYIGHIFGTDGDGMFIHDMDIVRVVPETVCQYTDLKDKNGKKIFEGDILKSDLGKIGKIAFNESHMAFMILEFAENKYYHVEECSGNHMEVIGNIFDNPELVRNDA